MPAYIGSKKVKELYYGGKKVKEAWYGSKKVYSSGPEVWKSGVYYRVGDLVTSEIFFNDSRTFQCIKSHTSDSDTEPYYGAAESGFWKMI